MMVEKVNESKYEMVGGIDKKIKEIKEVIEINVKNNELFDDMGIDKKKGVIIYGKKGKGKKMIDREVEKKKECKFIRV
jgi:26S proteasome regulatory subunit T6